MDKHNPDYITGGPLCNTSICKKIHVTVFEEFIRNARTNKYNIMCSIDLREKQSPSYIDDVSSSGVNALP